MNFYVKGYLHMKGISVVFKFTILQSENFDRSS